jgi:hypothetical protein
MTPGEIVFTFTPEGPCHPLERLFVGIRGGGGRKDRRVDHEDVDGAAEGLGRAPGELARGRRGPVELGPDERRLARAGDLVDYGLAPDPASGTWRPPS